jgi:hypothetical protein
MIVDQDLSAMGEKGGLIKAYLQFINSQEGQEIISEYGFTKLPQAVRDINAAGIDSIVLASGVSAATYDFSPPTFELAAAALAAANCVTGEDATTTAVIAAVVTFLVTVGVSYIAFFGAGKRAGIAEARAQSSGGPTPAGQVETAIANARRSVSPNSRSAYTNQVSRLAPTRSAV